MGTQACWRSPVLRKPRMPLLTVRAYFSLLRCPIYQSLLQFYGKICEDESCCSFVWGNCLHCKLGLFGMILLLWFCFAYYRKVYMNYRG